MNGPDHVNRSDQWGSRNRRAGDTAGARTFLSWPPIAHQLALKCNFKPNNRRRSDSAILRIAFSSISCRKSPAGSSMGPAVPSLIPATGFRRFSLRKTHQIAGLRPLREPERPGPRVDLQIEFSARPRQLKYRQEISASPPRPAAALRGDRLPRGSLMRNCPNEHIPGIFWCLRGIWFRLAEESIRDA
jgi:hypothetical protein